MRLVGAVDARYRPASRVGLLVALPSEQAVDFATKTFLEVCRWGNDWTRTEHLRTVVPCLLQIPPIKLYPALCSALHELASRPRNEFVRDLRALLPLVASIGGHEALRQTMDGSADVGLWFP
jgi:hypothetical protein